MSASSDSNGLLIQLVPIVFIIGLILFVISRIRFKPWWEKAAVKRKQQFTGDERLVVPEGYDCSPQEEMRRAALWTRYDLMMVVSLLMSTNIHLSRIQTRLTIIVCVIIFGIISAFFNSLIGPLLR